MRRLTKRGKVVIGLGLGLALLGVTPKDTFDSVHVSALEQKSHTVVPGDTLWRISIDNGVKLSTLMQANGKNESSVIYPGDRIVIPEGSANIEKKVEPKKESTPVVSTGYRQGLTPDRYQVLLEVVQQESGGHDYEAVLAVMSVITNRVDSGNYGGKDVWSVITAKTQFEAYGAGHYLRHRGKVTETTKRAVEDALNGKKNVTVMNFWSDWYAKEKGVTGQNIGGNVFFNL